MDVLLVLLAMLGAFFAGYAFAVLDTLAVVRQVEGEKR